MTSKLVISLSKRKYTAVMRMIATNLGNYVSRLLFKPYDHFRKQYKG